LKCRIDLLRKFSRLAAAERRLLVRAWLALHLVDCALYLLPFETVRNWCHSNTAPPQSIFSLSPPILISRCVELVDVAGRYSFIDATCLKEALVIAWLMGRCGVATTLKIGVARCEGALSAHAWLEQDGRIVFSREATAAYAPLRPCHHEVA